MNEVSARLYQLVAPWDQRGERDPLRLTHFAALVDEICFHGSLRFGDYRPFPEDGDFPSRLLRWLDNVDTVEDKQSLLHLVSHLQYFDEGQMRSLYRDAFSRIISPWISRECADLSPHSHLAADYCLHRLKRLREFHLFGITESFDVPLFSQVNCLSGIRKPRFLGEDLATVATIAKQIPSDSSGLIILEDFVGTGKQAGRVLNELRQHVDPELPVLFCPIIILEQGISNLREALVGGVDIEPVLEIEQHRCVSPDPTEGEPVQFAAIRGTIRRTKSKVLCPLSELDDPPDNEFGYKGCGALVVTCHNAPNNSVPLLHHQAPDWNPLFRRLHHSK